MTCLSNSSIFTAVEQHFTNLSAEPRGPLTLAITVDHGAEPTRLTIVEARDVALDRTVPLEMRDRIWRELIRHARNSPDSWSVAAVWMMLPGLKSATHRISRTTMLDIEDLRSAAITGFLEALATTDPDDENLGSTLYWAAYNAARAAARPRPQIRIDATDEIDRIAARIAGEPVPAVHRGVIDTVHAGYPSRDRLEAERLGSVAYRTGTVDRLHRPCHRRGPTRLDHREGPRGRRIVLRVCATPVRNIASLPGHLADRSPRSW